jgi:hypothetical protein
MGNAEKQRKSGLWENIMQPIGEEKVNFWSQICPLKEKNDRYFIF